MSVSDLTNTTWIFNNSIVFNISPQTFYINFTSDNYSYTRLQYFYDEEDGDMILYLDGSVVYGYGEWLYSSSRTITITGGADVTNTNFINWLQANATLQESGGGDTTTSTGKIGDLPIIKKHFGNLEIIKEVLNGVTIYEKEAQPTQSYSVTFTSSGYWYNQTAGKILIYDGQDTTGTLILDQNPANKSAFPITLTINSGYCCISIEGPFVAIGNGVTSNDYTIGIIWDAPNTIKRRKATIDKNGTININVDDFNS